MLIDTHAHLNFPDYDKDLKAVLERAIKAGVKKIICVSSNITESEKAIEIAKKHKGVVFAAVGIHPQQTDPQNKDSIEEQIEKLAKLAGKKEVVAIGECGFDFSPPPPKEKERSPAKQQFLFESQIRIAKKLNLPILVHCREAFSQTLETLKKYPEIKGVFHCYSAGKKGIAKIEKLGFLFGVDGNLTYDEGLQNVFRQIPLEKIVLETDCPFLAPIPFRGQRNEPAYIKIIAKTLAEIKNFSFEKVADTTTKNAFGLINQMSYNIF